MATWYGIFRVNAGELEGMAMTVYPTEREATIRRDYNALEYPVSQGSSVVLPVSFDYSPPEIAP